MRTKTKRPRGYVMLLVLMLVLVLTLLATRLLQSSYYDAYAMTATDLQGQAVLNSNMGIQEGLARVRNGQISLSELPPCLSEDTCPMYPPMKEYNDNTDPTHSRYRVHVFTRPRQNMGSLTFSGPAAKMIVISSTGFAYTGQASDTANRSFSALTEVEVMLPSGNGGTPGTGDSVGNTFGGGG